MSYYFCIDMWQHLVHYERKFNSTNDLQLKGTGAWSSSTIISMLLSSYMNHEYLSLSLSCCVCVHVDNCRMWENNVDMKQLFGMVTNKQTPLIIIPKVNIDFSILN